MLKYQSANPIVFVAAVFMVPLILQVLAGWLAGRTALLVVTALLVLLWGATWAAPDVFWHEASLAWINFALLGWIVIAYFVVRALTGRRTA